MTSMTIGRGGEMTLPVEVQERYQLMPETPVRIIETRGGHAQAGRRPAIVVQSADASTHLPTILLVLLTTQTDALRFPGTVLLEPDAANGLRRPSVALVFQLTVVDKQFVEERLGTISTSALQAVWQAFDEITD